MSTPLVFVCGATGRQGGALANHLSKQGIKMRTITRNSSSDSAQKIKSLGVTLIEGDFNDDAILEEALAGCTTIFLNLTPDFQNISGELTMAKKILSIAKKSGIKHIVYTGSLGTDNPERMPGWENAGIVRAVILSKQQIENEVRSAGFESWTILRPGNFMTNFLKPLVLMYQGLADTGVWTTPLKKDSILPMIDPNDIGKFAAAAVLNPAKFNNQNIELASEMISVEDILRDLSHATGVEKTAIYLTEEELAEKSKTNPLLSGQVFLPYLALFIDIKKLNQWNIELGTFAGFLEREQESVKATYN